MGVYLKHVTGSPFVTAYQISQKTYGWPVALAWTPPPHIENRHLEMANYYAYEVGEHAKVADPINFIEYFVLHLEEYWRFFFGPVLTIPLLMLGSVWRSKKMLFAGAAGAIVAILLEGAASPHYLAPAAAVLIAILVECCRHLQAVRIRILPFLPATMLLVLTLRIAAQQAGLPYTQKLNFQTWCCRVEGDQNKPRIAAELAKTPGNHLIFVKAKTDPANLYQWIYNSADLTCLARRVGPRSRRLRKRPARRIDGGTHHLDGGPQRQPRHPRALRPRYAENSFAIENAAPAASPPISVVRNALFDGDTPVKRPFT